jgi:hypothetical protein
MPQERSHLEKAMLGLKNYFLASALGFYDLDL